MCIYSESCHMSTQSGRCHMSTHNGQWNPSTHSRKCHMPTVGQCSPDLTFSFAVARQSELTYSQGKLTNWGSIHSRIFDTKGYVELTQENT